MTNLSTTKKVLEEGQDLENIEMVLHTEFMRECISGEKISSELVDKGLIIMNWWIKPVYRPSEADGVAIIEFKYIYIYADW